MSHSRRADLTDDSTELDDSDARYPISYISVCMYVSIYLCLSMYLYVYVCTRMYECMYLYNLHICMYVCIEKHVLILCTYVSSYCYVSVSTAASLVVKRLYMCPHTAVHVSSYYYISVSTTQRV
jgi:hypothetical protein